MSNAKRWLLVVVATLCVFNGVRTVRAQEASPGTDAESEATSPIAVLPPGKAAPEWELTGWSDGQNHKLADYQGKVVFLDFWGTWCGPCRRGIPALKQLQKQYAKGDVVFLAIHSAGSNMEEVKKALAEEEWSVPSGLDRGEEIQNGATVMRYGVIGFPTVVVIDRNGVVSYNSSAIVDEQEQRKVLLKMEQAAKRLEIPWPVTKDAKDIDEIQRRLDRLAKVMYSEEIDRALAIPHQQDD